MKHPAAVRLARALFLLPALAVAAAAAPAALGQAKPLIPRPAGQPVGFPHILRDNFNVNWDVQPDGSIGDGGNDQYDGGGRLMVGNEQYQSNQPQGVFNAAANEVTLGTAQMAGLSVHRRVAVNAAGGWCRWTEVLENNGAAPVKTQVHVNFDMGGQVQQSQAVNDPKKNLPLGVAIFDGQRGVGMLGGGAGAKVACRYQPQQGTDQVNLYYDVEIPAKQAAVVVHFNAWRTSIADAATFVSTAKEKEVLGDLPKELKKFVVNFRRTENALADIELPRQDLLDVVELRTGDQYRGTLKDATFKVRTFHGVVELPSERVVGMMSVGTFSPSQLFVTTDGEVVGGALEGDALSVQLSSGQVVKLPVGSVARVGCRKRPGESEELKMDKPMAYLRDGQRLGVELPAGPLTVQTMYGPVAVKPEWLKAVAFVGEDLPVHQVQLRDGSKFAGLLSGDALELKLRGSGGTGSSAGRAPPAGPAAGGDGSAASTAPVRFPLAAVARFQFAPADAEPDDVDPPTVTFANGDVLVGTIAGTLELETGFDLIRLNGPEVRGLKKVEPAGEGRGTPGPTEVTATMWDGATVSGRLKGDAIDLALKSGPPIRIPVALIDRYAHPRPSPSADTVERIKAVVKELADPDWKKRDRAAEQLRGIGPAVAGVLRDLRGTQPADAQRIIDGILNDLEKKKPAAGAAPAGGDVAPAFNGPRRFR